MIDRRLEGRAALVTGPGSGIGVNAASFGISAEVLDMDIERWNDVMRMTLGGVFVSCKTQARQMVRQGGVGPGLTQTLATRRFLDSPTASAAYLASPEAACITGDTFYVDGGFLTRSYPTLAERRPSGYESAEFLKTLDREHAAR